MIPQPVGEVVDDLFVVWHWKDRQWMQEDLPECIIKDFSPYHIGEIITSNGKSFKVNEVDAIYVDDIGWQWLFMVEKVGKEDE